MTATYRGRFAPSPTGPLHFGSLLAAVASWLDARAQGGEWLVRIEDVDATRTVPGAEAEILRLLEACALEWDGAIVRQSDRTGRYAQALRQLASQGRTYRCRCSRKEIADSALRGIEGPVYPGTCRALRLDSREPGADRVRVGAERVRFVDRVYGPIEQDIGEEIGDFVLRRRDGLFAYQLAVVVDDADQGITDVVRGADLLLSTPRQIFLQRLLGFSTPAYLHVPVATNAEGQKLSKQTGAPAIRVDEAAAALRAALHALGQPVPAGADPRAMLAESARAWDTRRIVTGRNAAETPRGV